ncbi:MAG: PD-(D/E)XK nuclease family protein [Nonlabens sp.]|uniref:PD-(D/E)XK nuclease family protein n=1 Tax=Nonlabens sp. TaxID=1888209 RepID=UPI003EF76BB4
MKTFLHTVTEDLKSKGYNLSKCSYVVPSRRVATFLNKVIASNTSKPIFEPIVYSVEDFISHVAQVEIAPDIDLLFDFYKSYCQVEDVDHQDHIDEFISWAPTILKDFNEIDRFLIEPQEFFNFLGNLKELEKGHWSILEPKTEMVQKYLHFWKKLEIYYNQFTQDCIQKELVYQGLAYRLAYEKAPQKVNDYNAEQPIVFLGLNALNKSEEEIIKIFLESNHAHIYWDSDNYFQENEYHEAGRFLRKYKTEWSYYEKNPFQLSSNEFEKEKKITIVGTSGSIGMAQVAGKMIQELIESDKSLDNTALVLADEALLLPVLSAVPDLVSHLNITMGLTLDKTPIASFFNHLIALKISFNEHGFYYKHVVHILESHFAVIIDSSGSQALLKEIHKENMVFLPLNYILKNQESSFLKELFKPAQNASELIHFINNISQFLKVKLTEVSNRRLELEQLLGIHSVIEQLSTIVKNQDQVTDVKTIHYLFKQLLPQRKLDFIGEPVKGLQVMGLLETRALDYEHIIMLSVNESVLPAGKSTASYIPYDMKVKFGLPTYSDKDSVYAYHFYRLLQRCKTAHLIYNSEPDSLGGGEKSRFLMQIESNEIEAHHLKNVLYANKIKTTKTPILEIPKDEFYFNRLAQIARSGFSPSSITSYIYNPIEFYRSKILKINEAEEVEEDMAANTMGTMIHKALEALYLPYVNQLLDAQHIKNMREKIDQVIHKAYLDSYKTTKEPQGKNTIMYEVARHYINKMLAHDAGLIKNGSDLIIKQLEVRYETLIDIDSIGQVKIHGEVDRIDQLDGVLRIIDYKSGKVEPKNVGLNEDGYDELIETYEKSKAFQVLMYAYLFSRNNPFTECSPGIISFKNFKAGFIPYQIKSGKYQPKMVDESELQKFEEQLHKIIRELYNPEIPLSEPA